MYLSIFSSNAEKYGPEKTPYLDTFHAVADLDLEYKDSFCAFMLTFDFGMAAQGEPLYTKLKSPAKLTNRQPKTCPFLTHLSNIWRRLQILFRHPCS